jgi:drug/metabolite transporter (DMT)-like permease
MLFMAGFCLLAPLGDAVAKILGDHISVVQLVAFRFALQALILVPVVWIAGRSLRVSGRIIGYTVLRTVLHVVALGLMFLSLRYLPLADAIAIAYVMPLMVLILGKTFLGEEVGPFRVAACAVGFIGTLLVVQPNFANVGAPALLPLIVAVLFSLFMLTTRKIARECEPITLQAISGIVATIILGPAMLIGGWFGWAEFDYTAPVGIDIWQLIIMGLLGIGSHLCMTASLRFAPSATVAPMQYLEIPIATMIGWLLFQDFPNGLAGVGIAITIGAGLYIIHRERISVAAMRQQSTPVPPAVL